MDPQHHGSPRSVLLAVEQVIEPVRSRCLCVRVRAPEVGEVRDVLAAVAKKESLTLPDALADRLAAASNRDLRRALLSMEVSRSGRPCLDVVQVGAHAAGAHAATAQEKSRLLAAHRISRL